MQQSDLRGALPGKTCLPAAALTAKGVVCSSDCRLLLLSDGHGSCSLRRRSFPLHPQCFVREQEKLAKKTKVGGRRLLMCSNVAVCSGFDPAHAGACHVT